MNRVRPAKNLTRNGEVGWSRKGSTCSCHQLCSVRLAGKSITITPAPRSHSHHALASHGAISEWGGLHQTRSPCQGAPRPSASLSKYRATLALRLEAAASTVKWYCRLSG